MVLAVGLAVTFVVVFAVALAVTLGVALLVALAVGFAVAFVVTFLVGVGEGFLVAALAVPLNSEIATSATNNFLISIPSKCLDS